MARVKVIRIKRFKRIQDVTLELGSATLLVGANNAGKSSVLQAIQFAVSLAQSSKLVGGVNWAQDKYELSFGQNQLLYCPVADALTLGSGGQLTQQPTQRIEIDLELEDHSRTFVTLRRGRNRNLMVSIEGQELGARLQDLSSPFSIYAPGLAGVPRQEGYLNLGLVRRTVARGDANLVLRNVLYLIRQDTDKWHTFLDDMRTLFADINFSIAFNQEQDEYINVTCSLGDAPEVPLDAAGTSVLQACQILGYVTLFQPRILLLDEPDSHLHPDRQRKLGALICQLAEERDFQVVMSTHSRHILDSVKERAQLVWLSQGNMADATDWETTRVLLELGALDSIDYFADGELRWVVATEDDSKEYLEAILEASGFPLGETEIVSYPGCSQVEAAIVLGSFLREKAPHVRLIIHKDRDYLSGETITSFEERLRSNGIYPFVTQFSDVEGYFLDPIHLAQINPRVSEERIVELLQESIRERADKSIAAITNLRIGEAYKKRNRGDREPNAGDIAVQAHRDYEADPLQMCRGDLIIGPLKAKLQREIGANPMITSPTERLRLDVLVGILHSEDHACPTS